MTCKQITQWLPELAGGELGPHEQTVCEEHLRGCPGCQRRLEELRDVVALLRQAGRETEVPQGFSQALHLKLAHEPPPPRPLMARILAVLERARLDSAPRVGLLLSAAAAVLVLLVAVAHRPPGHGPAPEALAKSEVPAPFQVPFRRVAVVHFDFVTDEVIDNVQFEVTLPKELAFVDDGKPLAERTLQWSGSLMAGSNPIPLAISGTRPGRYKVVAHAWGEGIDIHHDVWLEVVKS